MDLTRRNALAAGGSLLAAGALSLAANADQGNNEGDTLYGHGMVWNRELPGVAGELRLSFDLTINLQNGEGLGTAHDPDHPDWSIHFEVNSIAAEKRPGGEARYTMKGVVTSAVDPALVGETVAILAETRGDTTAIAIRVGENAFAGAGLVVISAVDLLIRLIFNLP